MEKGNAISKRTEKKQKDKQYVTVGEASKITGLHPHTVRKLVEQDCIACYKTPSGQRRINSKSLDEFIGSCQISKHMKSLQANFLYARVSTEDQLDDLERQIDYLRRPEYTDYTIVKDVSVGMDFKRKGLSTILDACVQNTIGNVVVAHKDIICRVGYELFEQIVIKAGGQIIVLDADYHKPDEQDLSDLLSIVETFCCTQQKRKRRRTSKPKDSEKKSEHQDKVETQ